MPIGIPNHTPIHLTTQVLNMHPSTTSISLPDLQRSTSPPDLSVYALSLSISEDETSTAGGHNGQDQSDSTLPEITLLPGGLMSYNKTADADDSDSTSPFKIHRKRLLNFMEGYFDWVYSTKNAALLALPFMREYLEETIMVASKLHKEEEPDPDKLARIRRIAANWRWRSYMLRLHLRSRGYRIPTMLRRGYRRRAMLRRGHRRRATLRRGW